jgi:hypothetical protein
MCVCSFTSLACNAHAPFFKLRPVPLNILPRYLINGTNFEKKVIEHKMCDRASLQLLSEIFCIIRRTERDMIENVY